VPKGWVTALGALVAYTTVGGNDLGRAVAIACLLTRLGARTVFNWSIAALLVLSLVPVFW
jgi:hypothetical protein